MGVEEFPLMFDGTDNNSLCKVVIGDEIMGVLKSMKCDQSLGPDDWMVEHFTHFFYIFKGDLLDMLEE